MKEEQQKDCIVHATAWTRILNTVLLLMTLAFLVLLVMEIVACLKSTGSTPSGLRLIAYYLGFILSGLGLLWKKG